MPVAARILIFGHDSILLRTRCLILKRAGFQVRTTMDLKGAAKMVLEEEIDLFILCRSVDETEIKDALNVAHEIRPEMKNLILSDDLSRTFFTGRDTVVDCFLSPEALVSVTVRLTTSKPMPGEDAPPPNCEPAIVQ